MNIYQSSKSNISFCVAVWGENFINNFLEYSLNSLLADGNIPNLSKSCALNFIFYSDKKGLEKLREAKVLSTLAEYSSIKFILIKGIKTVGNYFAMNDCHRDFIKRNKKSVLFFICPDIIFSDHAISTIYDKLKDGKKAVCMFTPRLNMESFLKEYKTLIKDRKTRALKSMSLLEVSCKHLHPETQSMILEDRQSHSVLAGGFFYRFRSGLIGSQFHYFPICVGSDHNSVLPNITVDNDYLGKLAKSIDEIAVIENAKDCCVVDITAFDDSKDLIKTERSAEMIAKWAKENTNGLNRDLFEKTFTFANNLPQKNSSVSKKATEFREKVLLNIDISSNLRVKHYSPSLIDKIKNNSFKSAIFKIRRIVYQKIFNGLRISEYNFRK